MTGNLAKVLDLRSEDKRKKVILISFVIFSEIFYLFFYAVDYLKKVFGDNNLVLMDNRIYLFVISTLAILTVFYISFIRSKFLKKYSLKTIFFIIGLFALTVSFVRPVASSDVYSYIYKSRIHSVYHQNPYVVTYDTFSDDVFFDDLKNPWIYFGTAYGPLFLLFASFLTKIAGDSLFLNMLLFKLAAIIAYFFVCFLIYKLTNNKFALVLYSLNPYIIFSFIIDAHNDIYMIALVLLSFYFVKNFNSVKYGVLSYSLFFLSIFIKYFSLVIFPFYLIYFLRKFKRAHIFFLVLNIAISVFILILIYSPFWEGPVFLNRISQIFTFRPLMSSVFIFSLVIILTSFGIEGSDYLARLTGHVLFALIYFKMLFRYVFSYKKLNFNRLVKYCAVSLALFFALFMNWYLPWYFNSVMALIAVYVGLTNKRRLAVWVYAITAYSVFFSYLTR